MIVAFTGRIGAGKNEAAKRLRYFSRVPVIEVSYAAKLKESVAALFGISLDDIERWKNDPNIRVEIVDHSAPGTRVIRSIVFRNFLQSYGTESHRNVFGKDFWLDKALPLDRTYNDAVYTITDCRFPNERQRIKDLKGVVVRINGPPGEEGDHESEQDLPFDLLLDNTIRDDGFRNLDQGLQQLAETLGLR